MPCSGRLPDLFHSENALWVAAFIPMKTLVIISLGEHFNLRLGLW
jgi:hypothetical protein